MVGRPSDWGSGCGEMVKGDLRSNAGKRGWSMRAREDGVCGRERACSERGHRGEQPLGHRLLLRAARRGEAAGHPGADGVKQPRPRAEPGFQGNGSASSGGAGAYH